MKKITFKRQVFIGIMLIAVGNILALISVSYTHLKQAIANLLKEKKTVVMIAHTLSICLLYTSGGEKQKIAFASVYAMNPQMYPFLMMCRSCWDILM